jgi:hypothetical protein
MIDPKNREDAPPSSFMSARESAIDEQAAEYDNYDDFDDYEGDEE